MKLVGFDPFHRDKMRKRELAFGDGAGLVRADAGDAADILHHDGAAHERLAAGQPIDAEAQEEGEGNRKFLRQSGNRERDSAEEGVEQAEALIVARHGKRHADQHGDDDEPGNE